MIGLRRPGRAPRKVPGLALLGALALLAGCRDADGAPDPAAGAQVIGLSTSLPIFWSEAADVSAILANDHPPHWALAVLRERGVVQPLDTLAGADDRLPLRHDQLLVLAQPWPLTPQENVALDDWVRAGGRVLLFADPMLTHPSSFALGDRRRPQDVAMLSPILTRWGLELRFDESQPVGEREIAGQGVSLPVNLAGAFALLPGAPACALESAGLIAACRVGKGRILAVADAALLEEQPDETSESRARALRQLLHRLR